MELLGVKQQLKSTFDQIPDSGKTGYIWFVREHDENNPIINPKHEIYINSRKYGDIVPPMVEVTYAELVTLVNDARLVPGQEYRITDYETTSVDTGTTVAGHQFDIIVTADDETTLNENVRFAQHEGDTYFNGCNLDAWEGKYSIDNNLNLYYEWADTTNGKGVIYYLKDEHRNECPYDFKNILFKDLNDTGVTMYTFSIVDNGVYKDSSISPINFVHDNVIKPFTFLQSLFLVQTYTQRLNRNIFFGQDNYYNTFATNSSGNTIYSSYNCTFGENCTNNVINSNSSSNNFGDNCSNNVLASYCSGNTFGNLCSNNTFGGNCQYNDFGNGFSGNTMGTYCLNNTFETGCVNNTFGSFFQTNTVFNGVSYLNFTVNYNPNYGNRLRNLHIYCGYRYNSLTAVPTGITVNANYCQSVGFQSDGTFKVKNLLDDELTAGTNITISDGVISATDTTYSAGTNIDITNGVISAIDMIEIEYADLVTLRNSSGLTPGMQYRITDYVTSVADGMDIARLGFQFDVIVFADDNHTLNENVRFAQHEGVTYFNGCNLDAWEGKYTIDNDTTLYPWASASGYGVIYYLKDEFRNECSYDFKSIVFNNIDYSGTTLQGVFTFSIVNNGVATDSTLNNGNYVHDNIIKPLITYQYQNSITQHQLNKNIFFGTNTYNNTLGLNSSGNTFYSVYNCTFGENCTGNVLNSGSNSINFEDFCINNTLGSNCFSNTLGTGCVNNSLGNGCDHNFFGHGCTDNVLNGSCSYNYFKNNCCYNTFNLSCRKNSFGNTCGNNTFRDNCVDNTFGNNCTNILTSSNSGNVSLQACTFGDGVHYLDFTTNYAGQTIQYLDVFEGYGYSASTAVPTDILTGVTYTQSIGFQSDGTFKVKNLLDDELTAGTNIDITNGVISAPNLLTVQEFNAKERYPQYGYFPNQLGGTTFPQAFMEIDLTETSETTFSSNVNLIILCNNYEDYTYYVEYNIQVIYKVTQNNPIFSVTGSCVRFTPTGNLTDINISDLQYSVHDGKLYFIWKPQTSTFGGYYVFANSVNILGSSSGPTADIYCKLLTNAYDARSWTRTPITNTLALKKVTFTQTYYNTISKSPYSNSISLGYEDYDYFTCDVLTTGLTINVFAFQGTFEGSSTKTVLVNNTTQNSITLTIGMGSGMTLKNMYGSSSISIPAGKSFEAEFTYWDTNVATFKGFLET